MARQIAIGRPLKRGAAFAFAVAIAAAIALASSVVAQTLVEPNPKTKFASPPAATKSRPTTATQSCAVFGPGFVRVPGTDACVKIGGGVTAEGTAGH